jgi:DNA-binding CsgD family transcriptional regulator
MTDTEKITQTLAEIAATADHYPGVVIVLNDRAERVEYMSARGLRQLGATVEELRALGPAYYERYFNPEEAHEYVPKVVELLERNDLAYSVTFFQQVRTGPVRQFAWHLSTARVLAQGAAGQPLLIICLSCAIDPESHITTKVQRLLEENNFLRRHASTFARLTPRERTVLRSLALGHSAPETAQGLHISVQTAETHRRNIRQKLGTSSAFDLGQYARAFDLI